jgi:NADH dehydrogenase FAD-containing subunit
MKKTKVIILGGGFGGVYAALGLDKTLARRADVEVTLVRMAGVKIPSVQLSKAHVGREPEDSMAASPRDPDLVRGDISSRADNWSWDSSSRSVRS